jgi:hypothetical protein
MHKKRSEAEKRDYVRHWRPPPGLSFAKGFRSRGIARSTYYDAPS